jgi:rifampicin phosphotransferase
MSGTADPALVGGKAANLARLAAVGASVPAWIVLPAAIPAPGGEPSGAVMAQIAVQLADAGLASAVLAVRSSAVGEDAAGASFAGQFETVLGVAASDRAALRQAIARVWASASAERVLAYRREAGADPPRMAVILQELVDAEAAGVAFSADPVTGDRSVAVVSAVHGLGEALVSGQEDGDSFRVRIAGAHTEVIEVRVATQERALRRDGAATRWVELGPAERDAPAITEDEAVEIARAAGRIAASLGAPQDVEWALVPGTGPESAAGPGPQPAAAPGSAAGPLHPPRRLVILQARPITTLPEGERRIWDNSNIVESYAGVTTPLTFSFARAVYEDVYRQFCALVGVSDALIERNRDVFAHMLGLIRGRVYYNLLNWYRTPRAPPRLRLEPRLHGADDGRAREAHRPARAPATSGRWTDLGASPHGRPAGPPEPRACAATCPPSTRRLDAALAPLADEDLAAWAADRLLGLYRRLEDELLRHWQPPLVNDFFAMIWFGVLGRLVERWLPDEPPTLVNDLLARRGRDRLDGAGAAGGRSPRWRGGRRRCWRHLEAEPDDRRAARRGQAADPACAALPGGGRPLPGPLRRPLHERAEAGDDHPRRGPRLPLPDDPQLRRRRRTPGRPGLGGGAAPRGGGAGARAAARLAARPLPPRPGQTRARVRDRENLRFERTRVFGAVRRIFLGLGHQLAARGRWRPRATSSSCGSRRSSATWTAPAPAPTCARWSGCGAPSGRRYARAARAAGPLRVAWGRSRSGRWIVPAAPARPDGGGLRGSAAARASSAPRCAWSATRATRATWRPHPGGRAHRPRLDPALPHREGAAGGARQPALALRHRRARGGAPLRGLHPRPDGRRCVTASSWRWTGRRAPCGGSMGEGRGNREEGRVAAALARLAGRAAADRGAEREGRG